jgi:hypothetical protein
MAVKTCRHHGTYVAWVTKAKQASKRALVEYIACASQEQHRALDAIEFVYAEATAVSCKAS